MKRHPIYRPNRVSDELETAEVRHELSKAINLLREPMPDTFLGRATHKPFPREKKEIWRVGWLRIG